MLLETNIDSRKRLRCVISGVNTDRECCQNDDNSTIININDGLK